MRNETLTQIYVKLIVIVALIALSVLLIWQKEIRLGLDLRGGSELRYKIRTDDLSEARKKTITQDTIDVIRKRIDPDGRLELTIDARADHRFYIQLPGMGPQKAARIEDLIRRAGKLRFCLVNTDAPERNLAKAGGGDAHSIRGTHTPFLPVKGEDGVTTRLWRMATYRELAQLPADVTDWLLVENMAGATGEGLVSATATQDSRGLPAIGFRFAGKDRVRFGRLTGQNKGRRLAIILDQDLYSAPNIEDRITREGIIRGKFTPKEVQDLVSVLRAGQLPADIELEWNNTVGAQLGEDSIRAGVRACIIALILVALFMAAYYLVNGVIADFAVMLNLLFVLGAMAALQSVLTLPGIAGLVLTLGMAVDANVLINERIREEQQRGKSLRPAVRSGYARAFVTIVDSNLTTLITAFILFGIGTGPVRGFAMTLSIGILLSMFSAIWVTRAVVDLFVELGVLRRLHMLQVIRKSNIPFSRLRHVAGAASLIAIVLGLAVFVQRGDKKLDTDLTGGVRAEMELKKGVPIAEFRARTARLFPNADVQSVWSTAEARSRSATPTRFSIRVRALSESQRTQTMKDDLTAIFGEAQLLGSLSGEGPWRFKAQLAGPTREAELRSLLARNNYHDSDIREILLLDESSTEFIIKARTSRLDEKKPDADLAAILDALDSAIVSQAVQIKLGGFIEDKLPPDAPPDAKRTGKLPISLSAICSAVAVREAIIRDILKKRPDDLRVVGHGPDEGAEIAREVAVRADPKILDEITKFPKTEIRVLTFTRPTDAELHISLNSPRTETQVRGLLTEAGLLDKPDRKEKDAEALGLVRTVIPAEATGKVFDLLMNPLSEDKAVQTVQQALKDEFQTELGAERIEAKLAPVEELPPSVDQGASKDKGFSFFKLTLDREIQMQEIRAALIRANQREALLAPTLDATEAAKATDEVYIKLSGDGADIASATNDIVFAFATPEAFRSIEAIGPRVAGEVRSKAILAVFLSWVAIIFYIWFRFGEIKFGIAAVIALIHDVLLTAGAVGVADALSGTAVGNFLGFSDIKINVTMIAAFLTLVGYSINDTIVVFDRIRENMGGVKRRVDAALVDASLNQILSRTILTSLTTFMALIILYILGGPVIHGFAFVMTFGIIVGTYSSIFIASPILIGWEGFIAGLRKAGRLVTFKQP